MKNTKTEKIAILLLALTMMVLMLVSGTFAKYTSTATGTDSVSVAKWSIKIGNTEIATSSAQTLTLDLFSTIKDTGGTAEADVAGIASNSTSSNKIIAPGTSGSFAIGVKNESDVNAVYSLDLAITNSSSIPLEFSTDGSTWVKPDAQNKIAVNVTNQALNMNVTDTTTVQWRWAFTGSQSSQYTAAQTDATDTSLGIAAQSSAPTATVTVTVTATQVD